MALYACCRQLWLAWNFLGCRLDGTPSRFTKKLKLSGEMSSPHSHIMKTDKRPKDRVLRSCNCHR
jgi:hypothetical protein